MDKNDEKIYIQSVTSSQQSEVLISSKIDRNYKFIIFNIIIGQLLAIIGVGNGKISEVIENDKKVVTPLLLTSLYYLILLTLWIIINRKVVCPRFMYIIIAIFDSQANFLNVYAFSVIHFNYLFIINVSSVFWTVLITWIFIKRYRYKKIHILAIGISIIGVIFMLYGCLSRINNKDDLFKNYKGLLYCLIASILYSV